jgi:Mn-dependent DtxR family transcriptional regulator
MSDLKTKIVDLLADYERCNIASLPVATFSQSLHVAKSTALKALQELIVEGRVEYARKCGKSAEPRFMLSGGR